MLKLHNLTIIGTSHIAKQSINEIKKAMEDKPDIVAVELDKTRLNSLLKKQKKEHLSIRQIKQIGFAGFIFAIIGGYVQKKLGKVVNANPGDDMLTAIKEARKHDAKIALIDQHIAITLRNLSKAFTFKEFMKILKDAFMGIFFRKNELKKYGIQNLDLSKVPSKKIIKKLMLAMKKRYPSLYKAIVEDRNRIMAKKLSKIMESNPDKLILAVVGAGHEEELLKLIMKNLNHNISYSFSIS